MNDIDLKAIPEFEGYSIDSVSGFIYSHKTNKWLPMKPNHPHGYGRTQLFNKGFRKWVFNHIKVVEVHGDKFGNKIPKEVNTLRSIGKSIDHCDSNKMNPSKSNLELMLHCDNVQRYYDNKNSDDCPIPDL